MKEGKQKKWKKAVKEKRSMEHWQIMLGLKEENKYKKEEKMYG